MIKNIGLIGAGAVGSMLISYLYPKYQDNFYILATGHRAERMAAKGVCINNQTYFPQVYEKPEQDIPLDLLIISSKCYSLDSIIEDIGPLIRKETYLLPILNGITATDRLKEAFPDNPVLYGIVQRTDAYRMGHKVFFNTSGELQMGYADNREVAPEIKEIHTLLTACGINAVIYPDMRRMQWHKWMLNTGAGQASVEIGVACGFFGEVREIVEIMKLCMDEILLLAKAENVDLTEADRDEILEFVINYPPNKKFSMLQDFEAGRPLEIEDYAGTVIRLGKKHGIPTPANRLIYLAITARENVSKIRKHM